MNWEVIGAVGEVLGAIGVIATLAYLAVQIRQNSRVLDQNNQMQEVNSYRANIDGVMNLQALLAQDERLGLIWKCGLADADLSDGDEARFAGCLNMWLFDLENKSVLSRARSWMPLVGTGADLSQHIEGQIRHLDLCDTSTPLRRLEILGVIHGQGAGV